MSSLTRVLVWCDSAATVRRCFDFFRAGGRSAGSARPRAEDQVARHAGLGLTPVLRPAHRSGRGPLRWLARDSYCASVRDGGGLTIEFSALPMVERLRHARGLPAACQVLALCLRGSPTAGDSASSGASDALQRLGDSVPSRADSASSGASDALQRLGDSVPSRAASAVLLQPLAWLDAPALHPLLLRDDVDQDLDQDQDQDQDQDLDTLPGPLADDDVDSRLRVKEVVFGEAEDRYYSSLALLRSLSSSSPRPGVLALTPGGPTLRVLPSSVSALVFQVPDLDEASAELGVEEHVRCSNIGGDGGRGRKRQVLVAGSFMPGLDVRLSESADPESNFTEAPLSSMPGRTVDFGRDDMGSMTCTSVNSMEMVERTKRLPKQLLSALGRHARPHYSSGKD